MQRAGYANDIANIPIVPFLFHDIFARLYPHRVECGQNYPAAQNGPRLAMRPLTDL